jgi:hypothetical protein
LTQAVKRRHQGRMVRVEVRQVLGEAVDCPYPVHEERWNGVLRDRLNALSHRALREAQEGLPEGRRYRPRTPAMAIGLTDHIWTWKEFLTFPHHQYLRG